MFVDAIGTERYSTTIIETLIDLAHNMRMESSPKASRASSRSNICASAGIFLAQGYVFAPPLPGPLFRQLLEAAHPLGAGERGRRRRRAAVDEFMAARDRVAAA